MENNANGAEVERAISLAAQYEKTGDLVKARKLIDKALKMDPSCLDAKKVLWSINAKEKDQAKTAAAAANGLRQRKAKEEGPPQRSYTEDQLKGVKRIKAAKTLYEVLQVERTADEVIIKKQYRKLALKFHPDKNGAPGADEAFKEINRAFSVLSDKSKRREYDLFGENGINGAAASRAHRGGGGRYYYADDDDFDPNEIFRQVFGAGFFPPQGGNVRMYTFGGRPFHQSRDGVGAAVGPPSLLQLLPLILLFALSFFSFTGDFAGTPLFSLQQTPVYSVQQLTRNIRGICPDLPYFVKPNFIQQQRSDKRALYKVEQQVMQYSLKRAEDLCANEKRAKRDKIRQLQRKPRSPSNDLLVKETQEEILRWCEEATRIGAYR